MAADIANLVVRISGDDKGASESLDRTSAKVEKTGGHFKDALKTALAWSGVEAVMSGVSGVIGLVKDNLGALVSAGIEANQVQAQTAAGIKSTGDASGLTAQQVSDLADHLSNMTGISADTVQSAENMLLTFTNIGKDVFPQATQAVSDLATKMSNGAVPSQQQMQTAAIQLGKALGDPAKGYAQLQRVGVTFTKQQIEQIKAMEKAGNIAGAQKIILGEMNKEFGGSAAAAGQANGGLAIFSAQLENAKEKIGQAIIPILIAFMNAIQPITTALSNALPGALNVVTGLFNQWAPVLSTVFNAAQSLGNLLMSALKPGLDEIGKALNKTTGPGLSVHGVMEMLKDVMSKAAPIVKDIGVIFKRLSDWFVQTGLPAIQQFGGFVSAHLLPIIGQLAGFVVTNILPALGQLGSFIVTNVVPAIEQLVTWFGEHVQPILEKVVSIVVTDVIPAVENIANSVMKNLVPALENLWNKISPVLIPALKFVGALLKNVVGPAISFVIGIVSGFINIIANLIGKVGDVMGVLGRLKDLLWGAISGAWTHLGDVVSGIWSGIQGAIKGGINVVIDILDNMIGKINSIHIDIPQVGPVGGGHIGFNIPLIPHLAGGGDILKAGLALVGEDGPEIVAMPAGSHVYSNQESGSIMRVSAASSATHLSSGGTLNGGGAGQTIILEVDGQRLARILLPHQVKAIRNATGVRSI